MLLTPGEDVYISTCNGKSALVLLTNDVQSLEEDLEDLKTLLKYFDNIDEIQIKKPWFVYLLECADRTLYCGISTNIYERLEQHNAKKGAKYTKARLPVYVAYQEGPLDESKARKREIEIKKMTKQQKLNLIFEATISRR